MYDILKFYLFKVKENMFFIYWGTKLYLTNYNIKF